MFSFEPFDRCLYSGIGLGDISEYVEQRFVLHFGNAALDNRFYVVLGRENIRFFYYDCDQPDLHSALNIDLLKELGCISLTNPKDTGNDILRFPQMTCSEIKYIPSITINEIFNRDGGTLLSVLYDFKQRYYRFPFWEEFDKVRNDIVDASEMVVVGKVAADGTEPTRDGCPVCTHISLIRSLRKCCFLTLAKCCFLTFVFEIEDRNERFAISPLYDHVRNLLRQSDVYKLLSAKLHYCLYIPQNDLAYNSEEYSYKARKYADGLMSKRINKVIPPHDYPSSKHDQQDLFRNPEEELEMILEQNRRQHHVSENSKTVLEDSLELKIRDFLYTKHAVYQAMTRTIGKRLFLCGQILMAITTLAILCAFVSKELYEIILEKVFPFSVLLFCVSCFLYYGIIDWRKNQYLQNKEDKSRYEYLWVAVPMLAVFIISILTLFYPRFYFVLYFGVVIFLISIICRSGINNNSESGGRGGLIFVFFPRILVAELAAWLTIGVAEDLVKSMLWVDGWFSVSVATIIVLMFIGLLLGGEIKQHSPYLSIKKILWQRIIPIINHSLFFAILIGLAFQFLFYDNLIKNSDALPSVVFNGYFDDANNYCQNLIDLDKGIRQYQDFYLTSSLKEMDMSGEGKSIQKHRINDSIEIVTTVLIAQQTSNKAPKDTVYHDILVNNINTVLDIIRSSHYKCDTASWISSFLNRGSLYMLQNSSLSSSQSDSLIHLNLNIIKPLSVYLPKEITNVRNCIIKYNEYDTLMNWVTAGNQMDINTNSGYMDALTRNAQKEQICCRKIEILPFLEEITSGRIFPRLLIFHTLIVLVLAFITQLIISEKSVTEPL